MSVKAFASAHTVVALAHRPRVTACAPPMEPGASAACEPAHAVPLIHNMSCRPSVTVHHKSPDQCRRVRFHSAAWPKGATAYADFFPIFGLPKPAAEDGYARLTEAASEPCPQLSRLPPVAAALRNAAGDTVAGLSDDPRLMLAVMTRCFGKVFMRDVPPSVTTESIRFPVTLLIPLSWNLNP